MPLARKWTEEEEATVRRLRVDENLGWQEIGRRMGIPCATLRGYAGKEGLLVKRVIATPEPPPRPETREPLPPGHPVTWGLLVAGSLLEGACYPHPVRTELHMSRISGNSAVGLALRGVAP